MSPKCCSPQRSWAIFSESPSVLQGWQSAVLVSFVVSRHRFALCCAAFRMITSRLLSWTQVSNTPSMYKHVLWCFPNKVPPKKHFHQCLSPSSVTSQTEATISCRNSVSSISTLDFWAKKQSSRMSLIEYDTVEHESQNPNLDRLFIICLWL